MLLALTVHLGPMTAYTSKLKSIFWDYDIDLDEIYETVIEKKEKAGP